jgi:hypothetical protein
MVDLVAVATAMEQLLLQPIMGLLLLLAAATVAPLPLL